MKKEKGITLIALIITIIVMLILVGVTVSVVLNGGLFKTASDAAKGTQYEADYEILQAGVIGAYNEKTGNLDKTKLASNLGSGWTVDGEGPYTCTSPNGNVFKVDLEGNIVPKKELTDLEKYILGENGEGRNIFEVIDLEDSDGNENIVFKKDTYDIETILAFWYTGSDLEIYIKCEGKNYRVQSKLDTSGETFKTTGINLICDLENRNRLGSYVEFDADGNGTISDDELYIVLYDEGEKTEGAQIISTNTLGRVTLGYNDPTIDIEKVEELDEKEGISNLEKIVYSYNNAIKTLNNAALNLIKNKLNVESIRNVGSNPINPYNENEKFYSSEYLKKWPINNSRYDILPGKLNGKIKGIDSNYVDDFGRLVAIKKLTANNKETYWFASRQIDDNRRIYFISNIKYIQR